ncbi:relaxase/mobilization nuclease domain-containing protein [Paratissierella segnis]|uniref:Relaxase/mobilization nuclease domain-containing protein n=1 Tax=Paratissierella segnis TaxID=2763679 RepID=A0A926EU79_9FIRM|nr:relaxase/mobilization nuclease domain-containing protein [Paratissierella segnis]MBC8586687.1 relaxase/mobilization nuclease domain-containing protein [Paratissierella segnis]
MATTRLISMHRNKGKSIARCLSDRIDYALNPDKTHNGKYVSSYECDPKTVNGEFLLSKKIYTNITGREQANDVIAYQIRQSFKPGEVASELANKIGYDLALKFTKGNHGFIVATHIDKAHIHNHIIYNSTSLDCTKKFRDFLGSGKAVRKISDRLCLENGLSIIENPKHGKSHYGKWLGDKKPITHSEKLRNTIDEILSKNPTDFDVFLSQMEHSGYSIKQGKYLAFKNNDQKKFIRLRSLGEGYTEEKIRAVINEKKPFANRKTATVKSQSLVNLLVDIQAKLQAGKGAGYERWAKIFNLKQMAQTMNYLTENNLLDYKNLEKKAQTITDNFNQLSIKIKDAEKRMTEIGNLKTHIINYSKTRDTYTAYRKAGYSKKFYDEHTTDLLLHKATKAVFDEIEGKKLPTVKALQEEYSVLLSEKKKAYAKYHSIKKEMKNILTAKANVDRLLGEDISEKEKEKHKEQR